MRRVAVVALLLLPLMGCGESAVDSYCDQLTKDRKALSEMLESDSPDALFANVGVLRALAKASPSDLSDEWQTFLDAVEGMRSALADADVKASQFVEGKPPAGLSATEEQAITAAADRLSSDEVVAAASGIEQQARDVCKVNLGL